MNSSEKSKHLAVLSPKEAIVLTLEEIKELEEIIRIINPQIRDQFVGDSKLSVTLCCNKFLSLRQKTYLLFLLEKAGWEAELQLEIGTKFTRLSIKSKYDLKLTTNNEINSEEEYTEIDLNLYSRALALDIEVKKGKEKANDNGQPNSSG